MTETINSLLNKTDKLEKQAIKRHITLIGKASDRWQTPWFYKSELMDMYTRVTFVIELNNCIVTLQQVEGIFKLFCPPISKTENLAEEIETFRILREAGIGFTMYEPHLAKFNISMDEVKKDIEGGRADYYYSYDSVINKGLNAEGASKRRTSYRKFQKETISEFIRTSDLDLGTLSEIKGLWERWLSVNKAGNKDFRSGFVGRNRALAQRPDAEIYVQICRKREDNTPIAFSITEAIGSSQILGVERKIMQDLIPSSWGVSYGLHFSNFEFWKEKLGTEDFFLNEGFARTESMHKLKSDQFPVDKLTRYKLATSFKLKKNERKGIF